MFKVDLLNIITLVATFMLSSMKHNQIFEKTKKKL